MARGRLLGLCVSALAVVVHAKDGFVFLGATGDNALRENGVWQGLYEAFSGGVFDKETVGIHVAMNAPHTQQELHDKVLKTLNPLYEQLKKESGFKCLAKDGDCAPESLLKDVVVNIWNGRDANDQAKNMTPSLQGYNRITVYMSVPPFVFGSWSKAVVDNWGEGAKQRVHVAAEKPFGTSLSDADNLHGEIVKAGVPETNMHLVDHWLSFFMNKHLPDFRSIIEPRLGISWSGQHFEKVVVTEYEERGLEGRGGFFDGVGQVRDMIQSHLLQVLALALLDPNSTASRSEAKLSLFNRTSLTGCHFGQYDGFLLEPKLKFHPNFADSTLSELHFKLDLDGWKDTQFVIVTGKDMGKLQYTVEFFQKGGPGILTYEIGKEETGTAGIKVSRWPLKDATPFQRPLPGFVDGRTETWTPAVCDRGNGYILKYDDAGMYFPKPYAMMVSALLSGKYDVAFVTYPECRRGWEIVTRSSQSECLDPASQRVVVYKPPSECGNTPPKVCVDTPPRTVEDLYNVTFACTSHNDNKWVNVSLYQAKCHPSSPNQWLLEALIV